MRTTIDLSPIFRSSIGFEWIFDLLDNAKREQSAGSWPPYDIAKTGEDSYRITMAVAGFSDDELTLTQEPNLLVVNGTKPDDNERQYLYRGIVGGSFEHRFELADHVHVTGSSLDSGLLTIDLVHELPEKMKPRRIEIGRGKALPKNEAGQIKGEKQAA